VLGAQLKLMQDWMVLLAANPHPTLVAMLPELTTLVEDGNRATARRDQLALNLRNFRDVGERRQLFDRVNAERKELHGTLSKLALSTPGLGSTFLVAGRPHGRRPRKLSPCDSQPARLATTERQSPEGRHRPMRTVTLAVQRCPVCLPLVCTSASADSTSATQRSGVPGAGVAPSIRSRSRSSSSNSPSS
jgi:hypothetical protein